ncbi:MAG: AAA family ATPase [Candidatus Moraniibacteriota bacterium]
MPEIIGHTQERARLRQAILSGAFPQSVLFSGPESIGKQLVALECAALLSGASDFIPTPDWPHPLDVLIVRPEQVRVRGRLRTQKIGVETIRDLLFFLRETPHVQARVVIIDDAHELSPSAQNALLKYAEEPLGKTFLIFITHEKGRLLDTLLSRLEERRFALVPEEFLKSAFAKESAQLPDFFLRLGRPGMLRRAHDEPEAFRADKDDLASLFRLSALSLAERTSLAERLSHDVPRAIRLLEWYVPGMHTRLLGEQEAKKVLRFAAFLEGLSEAVSRLRQGDGSARFILEDVLLDV